MSKPALAKRTRRLKASPIREILAYASKPGVISFAGGLPAKDSFPDISGALSEPSDLQYGPSEGEGYLREHIAEDLQRRGMSVDSDQVIVLSGSQQGIDLVAKLLVETETNVAVESPTYLAALQVFKLFGANLQSYDIDTLATAMAQVEPNLVYANPTFQNPSSRVYTKEERVLLAAYCEEKKAVLFEDDPYRDLVFEPCDRAPICSYMKKGSWIYQSTFSKTIAPGLRLGYLVCSEDLYPYLLRLKQAADLHSCRLSQRIVHELLIRPEASERISELQRSYKNKRDKFHEYLSQYFSDIAAWDVPAGGLFFWLKLKSPTKVDTRELLPIAIKRGVLFMPGEPFFADERDASNFLRLNFSNAADSEMEDGLKTLASIIRSHMKTLSV